jgi:hypothetical protein
MNNAELLCRDGANPDEWTYRTPQRSELPYDHFH